jgi:hypothetical protein
MRATAKQVVTITQTNDSASLHGEHSPRRPGCDQPSAQYEHLRAPRRAQSVAVPLEREGGESTYSGPAEPVAGSHGVSGSPVQVPFSKHG